MARYVCYTDGASSNNQDAENRVGGYGFIVFAKVGDSAPVKKEGSGRVPGATNNRMEMTALVEALKTVVAHSKAIKSPATVTIHSDSQIIVDAFNKKWLEGWKKRGWRKADRKEPENLDLWKQIDALIGDLNSFSIEKVKAHANDKWNNYVDGLAQREAGSK
jgi:ribonuclease HI